MTEHDYTAITDGDRYCLMCRWACPVERMTKREATSPHGWALLVASVQRGLARWDAETVDVLYQCADCGLCQANCATDRPLPAALVAARAAVVAQGAMPESVVRLDEALQRWGNPYGELPAEQLAGPHEVGLFVGAETAHHSPATVVAAQALLRAAGYAPALLCTGRSGVYLPYTVGLWDTARRLAQETVDAIRQAGMRQVLTLSREDTHAFAHLYAEIGVPFPEDVQVRDFADWLAAQVAAGELPVAPALMPGVVYHDPCHTPRLPGAGSPGRRLATALLGAAPGELFWRERRAAPCGAIGGFPFTQPGLAAQLARARLAEARQAGAQTLLTEDPHCTAHLAQYAEGLRVVNLVELAAHQILGVELGIQKAEI